MSESKNRTKNNTTRRSKSEKAPAGILQKLKGFAGSVFRRSITVILSILAAMIVGSIIILIYGENPLEVYSELF
ncbi:MAG: hypothetical protein JXB35_06085, partial [Anaerolineae bacterium]|nr:hypothetical protein [Anaerolineae bacterium]